MASLDRIVGAVQEKATNVLTSYYRSQNMVPSYVIRVTLWIEALQIVAIGLLASQEAAVVETVGFLIVPAVSSNGVDAATHGVLFWFAFA
jgi:LytS/YehU family sensor histidine kinase